MELHKIEVRLGGSRNEIYLDGKKLRGVRSVRIEQQMHEPPIISLEMYAEVRTDPDRVHLGIGPRV